MKNKYYKDYQNNKRNKIILNFGYKSMQEELIGAPQWLIILFENVWLDYKKNKFSYDGATFVRERYKYTQFEVASFIHDWFNSLGYVGKEVDDLFVDIMIILNYKNFDIKLRRFLMKMTPLNVFRHKYIIKDYKSDINKKDYINEL